MLNLPTNSKYDYFGLGERMSMTFFSSPSVELTQQNSDINPNEIQISNIKVRKEQESIYQNNVYFRDPLNNAYINVGLSNDNLIKLKEIFGENAVKSEDNQILLKGKAEEFVSSWYADIAYKRGYIRADLNNDGFLNIEERKNTNSFSEGYMISFSEKNVLLLNDDKFYLKFSSINNEDTTRINQYTSSSIEEELNRMIKLDKNANGSLTLEELWQGKHMQYLDKIIGKSECNGYTPPSFEEAFYAIIKTMKENKEIIKEELQKAGIDTSAIDLTASAKEIFEKIMSKENGTEILNAIKERLEKQSSPNAKQSVSNSTTQENNTTLFNNKKDENIFNEIAKLTKLDKETLAYNLANNENFEENIISIVEELTQNVDSMYASNTLKLASVLDIRV